MKSYDNYFRRLKGEALPTHDGDPDPGFYRKRDKDRTSGAVTWQPVAYFYDGSDLVCVMSNVVLSLQYGLEMWTHCCQHPITEEEYRRVAEGGQPWSDQDATVLAQQQSAPTEETESAKLERQIKEAEEGAKLYATIEDDATAAKAQDARDNLNKFSNRADALRKAELVPHAQKVDEINAKWQPLVKSSKAAANTLRSAMEDWERTKRAQQKLAEDKYNAAADRAIAAGKPIPAPPSSNAPAPAAQIKGASGKAASVGTIKVAVIEDPAKVFDYFKDRTEVMEILQKLANSTVQAGITVPGTRVEEDVKIK